jgi:hypothetical protein
VVDDMKDTANKAYFGWPDRIYIVGADGKVAYKGDPGPWGFKPKDAERELDKLVSKK